MEQDSMRYICTEREITKEITVNLDDKLDLPLDC